MNAGAVPAPELGPAPHARGASELQNGLMRGGEDPCDGRLGVALTYRGDIACLALTGELDLACVPRFEALVASAFVMADRCRLDLRELAFVDSIGVRALLRARRRAQATGASLEIVNATPVLGRVLAEAGVEQALGGDA
jgi:anti-sigma B factor antagonist